MSNQESYGTYDRFLAYRAAIMQAIALAWRDPAFREKLIADPKRALKEGVGYTFPFNMDIAVLVDNDVWEPDTVGDWRVIEQDHIEMVLPPAPEEAEQLQALAAFNAKHLTFLQG